MAMEAAPMPTTTSHPRPSIKQEAETPPIMAKHDTTSEGASPTSVEATTRQTNNHSTPPRPPPPSRSDTGDITEKHFNMARTPRHCNKSREAAAQVYESTSKEGGINVVAPSSTSEGRSRTSSSSRDREQQGGEPSSTSSSSRRVVVHRSYYPPNHHHHNHAPPPPSHYEGYWESTHPSSPNPHHPYAEHPPGDPRYHPSPHHDPRYAHSYPHPPPPPPHDPYHDHHERRHRSSSRGYYDYHHPSPRAYYDSPHQHHSSHHYYAPPTRGEHHSSREVREHSSHPAREHHTIVPPAQQQQQRDRFYSNDSTSCEVQRVRGESLSLPSKDGSLHAVSSSFSHEGNKSLKNGSVAMKAPQLIAVKQSPGVVTHAGSVGSSIDKDSTANTGTNQSTIPNQPSLKSTSCEQDDDASDSSWRQLQQIASVDKDEMLRLQTSKSGELAANTPTLGMMSPNTTKGNNCKVKESSTLVVEKKLEVETVHKEEGVQEKQQQQQQQSPGDLKEVPSTLSRTSSLSNSPTDEHHNHQDHRPGPRAAEDEYHHHESYQYPPHQYHTSPHHHHPARYPPPRLSMIPQGGAAENEEDPSPSASTISTKASLLRGPVGHGAGRRLEEDQQQQLEQQQPQDFFRDNSPPTMKPKHPVHVKKSREESKSRQQETDAEVVEAKRRKLSDTSVDAAVVNKEARNDDSSPVDSATSSEGLGGVAKDIASPSTHVALDGRVMAESPTDNPTNSANSAAGQSHHSNQSLELGAMPSWETAGKPLAGWSVCSGMTEIGMGSLKDGQGLLSGAFSFSEVYKSDNNGGSGKESGDDSPNNLENEEQDPSPKSILSKDGEKRKSLAPGTHVQFSRETGRHPSGLEVSKTSASSSGSRKRSRGASSSSAPQPPPPHYDEYYYDYPRHPPAHPYDYGRPGMPPPPPGHHPGSRGHPREHVYYLEDDPYHYYGHHPPPPQPYGYPRRHPRGPPSHLPPHHDYPPHHAPPPHQHARGRPTISTVHTPPGIHHPDPHHHHLPPPITSSTQFSSARGSSGASTISLSAGGAGWDKEDDMALMEIMKKKKNPKNWEGIASKLNRNKSSEACQERWTRYLKPGSRKGQWTDEEDHIVVDAVTNSVEDPFTRWSDLASQLPGRVGKQVRDRWVNHLNPAINHLPFSRDDDLRLWEGHHVLGKRWVEISTKFFKGTRSENHIKNRWYSASFKKFIAKEFGPDAYSIGNENPGCGGRIDGGAPPPVMSPVHHVRHYGNSAPIISGDHLSRDL